MVGISFQNDVKDSFLKVKEDITNLKRTLNRELLAIEELSGKLQAFTTKDEFYNFIKRLGERLDKIESSLEIYNAFDEEIKGLENSIKVLNKKLGRQEDLSSEVKEVRRVAGRVASLEGAKVDSVKFTSDVGKLSSAIALLRKEMLTPDLLGPVSSKLGELSKKLEKVEKSSASKDEIAISNDGIASVREDIESLKKTFAKSGDLEELSVGLSSLSSSKAGVEELSKLSESVALIREGKADSEDTDKRIKDLRKDLNSIKQELEMSVSEVDLSEYLTKKSFDRHKSDFVELEKGAEKLSREISKISSGLSGLKGEFATIEDVRRIGGEVSSIAKSIDSLRNGVEKAADAAGKRMDSEIRKAGDKFARELGNLRSDYDEKLKKVSREKSEPKSFVRGLGKGISDFFMEEGVETQKKAEARKESEKKDKGKKEESNNLVMIFSVFLIVILLGGIIFFFAKGASVTDVQSVDKGAAEEVAVQEDVTPAEAQAQPEEIIIDGQAPAQEEVPAAEEVQAEPVLSEEIPAGTGELDALARCKEDFECKERSGEEYWFSCYLDEVGECRCFVTDSEGCGIASPVNGTETPAAVSGEVDAGKGNFRYLAVVLVVLVIVILIYIAGFSGKKSGKAKQQNNSKKDKQEDDGTESVNLEEFFEKK